MALTTLSAAGAKFRAAEYQAVVGELRAIAAVKSADESVTSSTVLQNDDELLVAVEANATYDFRLNLRYDATAASDIKFKFSVPTSTTMFYALNAIAAAATANVLFDLNETSTPGLEGGGAGVVRVASMDGHIVTSSTAGTVTLQWAQNTSGGTATIVKAGSRFVIRRIA